MHDQLELTIAVQIGDHPAHLRPHLDVGDLAQQDGDVIRGHLQRHRFDVLDGLQVAAGADHVLGLGQFHDRAADLAVGRLDRRRDTRQRDAEGGNMGGHMPAIRQQRH